MPQFLEPTLYSKEVKSWNIYVNLYVNDLVITETCSKLMEESSEKIKQNYEITDTGSLILFGTPDQTLANGILISRELYTFSTREVPHGGV